MKLTDCIFRSLVLEFRCTFVTLKERDHFFPLARRGKHRCFFDGFTAVLGCLQAEADFIKQLTDQAVNLLKWFGGIFRYCCESVTEMDFLSLKELCRFVKLRLEFCVEL
ncbi:hypothetical protein PRI8871_03176 [Pseudoprimorskyibacter insulae]|uniref:Uncharacterized protein n=1 Tax=Pseudoprimorskyibacter insulae TaxID=1695997 RepID=A0A2R8AZ96_9RHOB|nr:hypothetical protein PRI8871_03176 [Pseudoprimorskyibacter insulae]